MAKANDKPFLADVKALRDRAQHDIAQAETEHVIRPNGMADNLGWKPIPRIRGGSCVML